MDKIVVRLVFTVSSLKENFTPSDVEYNILSNLTEEEASRIAKAVAETIRDTVEEEIVAEISNG